MGCFVHEEGNCVLIYGRALSPMPEQNPEDTTPVGAQAHRLLTLLTVTSLNLGMLQRTLDKDGADTSARTRVLVERIAQTHRNLIAERRPPRGDARPGTRSFATPS